MTLLIKALVLGAYWQYSGKQYGDSLCAFYDDIRYTAQIVTAKPLLALLITVKTLYMKFSVARLWHFDGFLRVQSAQSAQSDRENLMRVE